MEKFVMEKFVMEKFVMENPSYKWINSTYLIYNWGYNPLTKWDEPPSNGKLY